MSAHHDSFVLAYLGGVLTIVSPASCRCCLRVRPGGPAILRSGLPMLVGMAATFAAVATLAAGWRMGVEANEYGRLAAWHAGVFSASRCCFPPCRDRMTRPLVAIGCAAVAKRGSANRRREGRRSCRRCFSAWRRAAVGAVRGAGTGLDPHRGRTAGSERPDLVAARWPMRLGAATSLALALLVGGRVFAAMKRSLGRRRMGAPRAGRRRSRGRRGDRDGLDTGFLTRVSAASTASLEQGLLDGSPVRESDAAAARQPNAMTWRPAATADLPVEGKMPPACPARSPG